MTPDERIERVEDQLARCFQSLSAAVIVMSFQRLPRCEKHVTRLAVSTGTMGEFLCLGCAGTRRGGYEPIASDAEAKLFDEAMLVLVRFVREPADVDEPRDPCDPEEGA